MLKTDKNSIDFVWEITKLEIPSRLIAKKSSFDLESYSGDEEMIKLLCDANTITISLYNCGVCRDNDWDIRNKFDIENISINDFKSNAQIFYGAVINYVGQEEDTVETYKEDVKNLTYARVLGTDTRYLKKDDEKSQIWDKYLDQETGYTIYHMKDCKSFIGFASKRIYNFEWQFHALEKSDCEAKYFFELICTCRDKEDNDGHRLPKKPFELAEGELQINVEGNDSPLIPLVNNLASFSIHQKKLRGDEHCYYEVPSALMESIVDSKKIKLKAFGSEHKSAKLRKYGIFVGSKMTKKWELAYKLIAHPDKKGKYLEEYHNYLLREKVWNYVKSIFAKF